MKLFLKLFAGILSLLIIAIIVLLVVIDPNDYKQEIQLQVKQAINRELEINGDIGWSFYPQLGFTFNDIAINNPPAFNRKHLLKIDNAAVSIELMPLFSGNIQVGELTLNGLQFNLITNKDGTSNLDNIQQQQAAQETTVTETVEETQPASEDKKSFAATKLQLAGVNINQVEIEVQNLQTASTTKINIDHIHLGQFTPGKEADLSIATTLLIAEMNGSFNLKTKLLVSEDFSFLELKSLDLQSKFTGKDLPNGQLSSTIKSNVSYDLLTSTAEISKFALQLDKLMLEGNIAVVTGEKTQIRFALQGNEWDLTPYLAQPIEKTTADKSQGKETAQQTTKQTIKQTEKVTEPKQEQEPDLSFLQTLDMQGTLTIAGIKTDKITVGQIKSMIKIDKGKAQIKPLTAQLYDGLLTINAQIDDAQGKNSYQLNSKLKDVNIYPLLKEVADIDFITGKTQFNLNATGKGLTPGKIKSGLIGDGNFKLIDGKLYGIDLHQEFKNIKALMNGKTITEQEGVPTTDFASLTGSFKMKKGVVNNNKLLMTSPVVRLNGAGKANILDESLDYKLTVTPLTKTDQEYLQDIYVPLLIKGSFTQPEYALDTKAVLQQVLEKRAKAELKKLFKDDSDDKLQEQIIEGFNSLFN